LICWISFAAACGGVGLLDYWIIGLLDYWIIGLYEFRLNPRIQTQSVQMI